MTIVSLALITLRSSLNRIHPLVFNNRVELLLLLLLVHDDVWLDLHQCVLVVFLLLIVLGNIVISVRIIAPHLEVKLAMTDYWKQIYADL